MGLGVVQGHNAKKTIVLIPTLGIPGGCLAGLRPRKEGSGAKSRYAIGRAADIAVWRGPAPGEEGQRGRVVGARVQDRVEGWMHTVRQAVRIAPIHGPF